jgi:hypothetical protein
MQSLETKRECFNQVIYNTINLSYQILPSDKSRLSYLSMFNNSGMYMHESAFSYICARHTHAYAILTIQR